MSASPLTLVLGATPNPSRYAFKATQRLQAQGHPVFLLGIKAGEIGGQPIHLGHHLPSAPVDTVTLYLGPQHQAEYYDYLLTLAPRRILFNPGTENPELQLLAEQSGIACENACTLVLLASGGY
ncbi:MAG: CoA-binding protein [Lewinella sp.]|nr:CoA-binding protein [Lewinella sp.]